MKKHTVSPEYWLTSKWKAFLTSGCAGWSVVSSVVTDVIPYIFAMRNPNYRSTFDNTWLLIWKFWTQNNPKELVEVNVLLKLKLIEQVCINRLEAGNYKTCKCKAPGANSTPACATEYSIKRQDAYLQILTKSPERVHFNILTSICGHWVNVFPPKTYMIVCWVNSSQNHWKTCR